MGKDLKVIKKILLMITSVVHVLETMNQLNNVFSAHNVKLVP